MFRLIVRTWHYAVAFISGTLDTFAISWFMTGKVHIAGSIAGIEIVTKIAWYYLHERVWALVPWGRRPV